MDWAMILSIFVIGAATGGLFVGVITFRENSQLRGQIRKHRLAEDQADAQNNTLLLVESYMVRRVEELEEQIRNLPVRGADGKFVARPGSKPKRNRRKAA